jgi:predicted aconitase
MDANSAEPTSWIIQFGIVAFGAIGVTLASFFKGLRSPEKPDHKILTAEIADTTAVAAKIVAELTPPIRDMREAATKRDEKLAEMRTDIKRLIDIVERMQIRNEERDKAEERARWQGRGPAE